MNIFCQLLPCLKVTPKLTYIQDGLLEKKARTWFYLSVADRIQWDINESLQLILRKGLGLYWLNVWRSPAYITREKSFHWKIQLWKFDEKEWTRILFSMPESNSLSPNYTYTSFSFLSQIEIVPQMNNCTSHLQCLKKWNYTTPNIRWQSDLLLTSLIIFSLLFSPCSTTGACELEWKHKTYFWRKHRSQSYCLKWSLM